MSSRKIPAHSQVAPWKNRCRPGWCRAGCRSATTSAASRATSGCGPRAVRANRNDMTRLASRELEQVDPELPGRQHHRRLQGQHHRGDRQQARHAAGGDLADQRHQPGGGEPGQQARRPGRTARHPGRARRSAARPTRSGSTRSFAAAAAAWGTRRDPACAEPKRSLPGRLARSRQQDRFVTFESAGQPGVARLGRPGQGPVTEERGLEPAGGPGGSSPGPGQQLKCQVATLQLDSAEAVRRRRGGR